LIGPGREPVLAIGAVIVEDDRLLLIKRGQPPGKGRWSLPGGRVEPHETLEDAVRRELTEETGIDVEPTGLLGTAERIAPGWHYVILDFSAEIVPNGKPLVAGDDADAVRFVPISEVLGLPLVDGLAQWLADHGVLPGNGS
jgi:8-oxo-dGTP diphosphatase